MARIKSDKKSEQIRTRVTKKLHERLYHYLELTGENESDIIRQALVEYLNDAENQFSLLDRQRLAQRLIDLEDRIVSAEVKETKKGMNKKGAA